MKLTRPEKGNITEWRQAATSPLMLGLLLAEFYGFKGWEGQRFTPYDHLIELDEHLVALCDGRLYDTGPGPIPRIRATYMSRRGFDLPPKVITHKNWYDTYDENGDLLHEGYVLRQAEGFNPKRPNDQLVHRLGVALPIRHGKSMLCSLLLPVWYMLQNPSTAIIVVGHTADFAHQALAGRVQPFLNNYMNILGIKKSGARLPKKMMHFQDGSYIMFTGIDVGVLGNAKRLGILDDPVAKLTDMDFDKFRRRQEEFYSGEWLGRATPVMGLPPVADVVVFSRAHIEDIAGKFIIEPGTTSSPQKRYYVLHKKALIKDDYGEERSLCEPMVRLDSLLETREQNPRVFQSQYQNDPRPVEGMGFPPMGEWPRYEVSKTARMDTTETLIDDKGVEVVPSVRFITIDLSGKATSRSDYTVFLVWDYSMEENKLFLRDVVRRRMEAADHMDALKALSAEYSSRIPIEYAVCEDAALAYNMMQTSQRDSGFLPFDLWISNRPGGCAGPKALSKNQRIGRYADAVRDQKVLLPRDTYDLAWWVSWQKEHDGWPLSTAHDDQMDAAADAVFEIDRIRLSQPIAKDSSKPEYGEYGYRHNAYETMEEKIETENFQGASFGHHNDVLGW